MLDEYVFFPSLLLLLLLLLLNYYHCISKLKYHERHNSDKTHQPFKKKVLVIVILVMAMKQERGQSYVRGHDLEVWGRVNQYPLSKCSDMERSYK